MIASVARTLAHERSADYALYAAPLSPYAGLTGNSHPEHSRLRWLIGQNKCNQFVGDVLTYSGYRMPVYRMPDGSEHYVNAEVLPRYSKYFERLTRFEQVRPGDIIVFDWKKRSGENGAHVEIVTHFNLRTGKMLSTTARPEGASEKDRSDLLRGAKYDAGRLGWRNYAPAYGDYYIYFIRPRR